jgi:hypothetical protein
MLLAAVLILGAGAPLGALTLRFGLAFGTRSINDALLTSTYNPGPVFAPSLELAFGGGWFAGLAYEPGRTETGALGVYDSPAEFSLSGLELRAGYELRLKAVAFTASAGFGPYSYKQNVEDEAFAQDHPVDQTRWGWSVGAGFKVYPWKFLFLSAGARYVGLAVKPYDRRVDLGGWRLLGGLGLAFDL